MKPDYKFRRIGVRLVRKPGKDVMLGYDAAVYDVETGDYIPAIKANINIAADDIVTATITVDLAELEVVEADDEAQS